MGVERETEKKAEQKAKPDNLTALLDKNIRKKAQELNHSFKANKDTAQSLIDSSQNMLYIIDGVYVKDWAKNIKRDRPTGYIFY